MRQKSIENAIRSLATSLNDQFALNLEKKSVEWRHRIQINFEKRCSKLLKKNLKHRTQTDILESKNCYSDLLFEQREQFTYFVKLLLPVMVML